jgi:hypothetical protein
MERPPSEVADISKIEPRLAWSLRLYQPYGELTRESLAERVCQLAGIPPELSEEEIDALIICGLMTQRVLSARGAPPDWESAELVDYAGGLVAQRVPVEVGRRLARRMLDAGRVHPEEFAGDFWLALNNIIVVAYVRPLVEAGFAKVWATARVGRPPEPPEL